jgi:hypothetical protein
MLTLQWQQYIGPACQLALLIGQFLYEYLGVKLENYFKRNIKISNRCSNALLNYQPLKYTIFNTRKIMAPELLTINKRLIFSHVNHLSHILYGISQKM